MKRFLAVSLAIIAGFVFTYPAQAKGKWFKQKCFSRCVKEGSKCIKWGARCTTIAKKCKKWAKVCDQWGQRCTKKDPEGQCIQRTQNKCKKWVRYCPKGQRVVKCKAWKKFCVARKPFCAVKKKVCIRCFKWCAKPRIVCAKPARISICFKQGKRCVKWDTHPCKCKWQCTLKDDGKKCIQHTKNKCQICKACVNWGKKCVKRKTISICRDWRRKCTQRKWRCYFNRKPLVKHGKYTKGLLH